MQNLFEKNLTQITGLGFIKSEFSIQSYRLDTLASGKENNSFVITEYKCGHNYSVFDQGVSYLNTLLKYKADFVLEYNETLEKSLRKDDVDRSQNKIAFVNPAFNQNQKQAVDFKNLNIELWEIKRYENDIIVIDGVKKSVASPSTKQTPQKKDSELVEITKQIKSYTKEGLLEGKSDEVAELYNGFKQAILNLSSEIKIIPQRLYLAFKIGRNNITNIQIQNKNLKISINMKREGLEDPKKMTRDISPIGHWGNGDCQMSASDTRNIEYIVSSIKQAILKS